MEIEKRLYTVDDVLALQSQPGNADRNFELIRGELLEMSPANLLHSWLASEISRMIGNFVADRHLGYTLVEGGFSPEDDQRTLLAPDVAYFERERLPMPLPQSFAGFMPDLAVEIASPSNSIAELRRKAEVYLENGTRLVWIVIPDKAGVETLNVSADGKVDSEFIDITGTLSGEDVLPGFELPLRTLFPAAQA